ncbi:MAG: hypothetical protein ACO1NW_01540, partial [Chitinophagaceae bacterium]
QVQGNQDREDRPMLITEIRDVLYTRLSPAMQNLLDVKPDRRPMEPAERLLWRSRTHSRVARAFHRFLDTIDPSVLPKNKIRPWTTVHAMKIDRTVEEVQERRAALTWVANRFMDNHAFWWKV